MLRVCTLYSVFRGNDQFIHTRAHVHLLRAVSAWTTRTELPRQLEKVSHTRPTGKTCTVFYNNNNNKLHR